MVPVSRVLLTVTADKREARHCGTSVRTTLTAAAATSGVDSGHLLGTMQSMKEMLATIVETGNRLAVDPARIDELIGHLESGAVALFGVSGKLASGKDTIAKESMIATGHADAVHRYYADDLKGEVDDVINAIRGGASPATLSVQFTIPVHQAEYIYNVLVDELVIDPSVHARRRTPGMRAVLQYWGTDIRRAQDYDYWVKLALRGALEDAAAGRSVYFTDMRFPNEVRWAQDLGFLVARIEVTPETQAARLAERDSLPPDPTALMHASETALDDYAGFDLVVDNNGTLESSVAAVVAALDERFPRR